MPANEVLYVKEIADSFSYVNNYADLVTSQTREEIGKELSESEELYDVGAKEAAIEEELSSKLADDEGMKMLAEELPKMIKKLKEFVEKNQMTQKSNLTKIGLNIRSLIVSWNNSAALMPLTKHRPCPPQDDLCYKRKWVHRCYG